MAQRSALVHRLQLLKIRFLRATKPDEGLVDSSVTVALVDEMRRIALRDGADFMAATTVRLGRPSARVQMDGLLRGLAEREIYTLDLDRAPGFSTGAMVFPQDGHWNASGHEFVARQIATTLAPPRRPTARDP